MTFSISRRLLGGLLFASALTACNSDSDSSSGANSTPVRAEPFSIRAVVSDDDGKTWSDPIVLRDDGCSRDVGYTRTVQRSDGKLVTAYYFCDDSLGPERYVGVTIWEP